MNKNQRLLTQTELEEKAANTSNYDINSLSSNKSASDLNFSISGSDEND